MVDWRIPNSEACLRILRQTPTLLRDLLSPVAPEQLDWRPAAGRWSIGMVLAHLADVEIHGFRSRFEAMLGQDQPLLAAYDQLALFRSGAQFDARAEMAKFGEERGVTLTLLSAMPDGAGDRSGRHAEFAFHDLGHTRQIMEIYRSRVFYPEMGAYQSYYKINP